MDSGEETRGTVWRYLLGTLAGLAALAVVVVSCVALSGWMNRSVETVWGGNRAVQLGTVGQYFDAGSAVFSGLALLLVIGTTVMQRKELAMQRDALSKSHWELRRSAEADLRRLHMELIKMAIDDPALADVWGDYRPGIPPERKRQYLYANLIFSHMYLNHKLAVADDVEMLAHLRVITKSEIFREYWAETIGSRAPLSDESAERIFGRLVDQAIAEPWPDEAEGPQAI
ncbi:MULTISPECIES: DUF6082 family protein [Streptacidiphilus]|uniref:DUF6082 family protein n=1 Tax=Streptacidiphilus cavernicola TaxID=3342716 RepID=A0ABV6UWS0_9ACTN|nr:DUF6082 family protein [Streptacidiphilus jeojiense]